MLESQGFGIRKSQESCQYRRFYVAKIRDPCKRPQIVRFPYKKDARKGTLNFINPQRGLIN